MKNHHAGQGQQDQSMTDDRQHPGSMDTDTNTSSKRNSGNFANDPQRAAELGSKGGKSRDFSNR